MDWRTTAKLVLRGHAAQALAAYRQRKSWPLRTGQTRPDPAPVIRGFAIASLQWIEAAESRWQCGGVAARYDLRAGEYQAPYPETTGYIVPTWLAAAREVNYAPGLERARAAGQWLRARQHADGRVNCEVSAEGLLSADGPAIVFDCGAILQGFCALLEAGEGEFRPCASGLARFLVDHQDADGCWSRFLYFDQFGAHNALVAYALIRAGLVLGDKDIVDAGRRCLAAIRPRIADNGYIFGCEFSNSPTGRAFLHPFVYTIEGYLKAHQLLPEEDWLSAVRAPLGALLDRYRETRCLPPSHVDEDLAYSGDSSALTAVAQLCDAWLLASELDDGFDGVAEARELMTGLRGIVRSRARSRGVRGGLPSSYPIDGRYGAWTLNNWGAKYFVDASMRELQAIVASGEGS